VSAVSKDGSERTGRGHALRTLVFGAALAACLAHLGVIAFQRDASYDLPWHLALGNELLDTHHVPRVDRYSYTFAGRPYTSVPWLSELLLAASFRLTGSLLGPSLLNALCLTAAFLALHRLLRARGVGSFTALAVLAVAFEIARPRLQLRPEMFFPMFLAALLWLLHWHDARGSRLALVAVAPLVALYANVHLAPTVLLLGVLGAHVAGRVAAVLCPDRFRAIVGPRPATPSVVHGLVVLVGASAATLLNPTHLDPLTSLRLVTPAMARVITEYTPVSFGDQRPLAQAFLALTCCAVLVGWHPRALPGALIVGVLGAAAFRYQRLMGTFAIVAAPFLALALAQASASVRARAPGRRRLWAVVGALGLGGLCVAAGWEAYGHAHVLRYLGPGFEPAVYPEHALAFVRSHAPAGRLLNDYGFGGYLIWRAGPRLPVMIDGRTSMLYDDGFVAEFWAAMQRPADFQALADRHGVTMAMMRPGALGFHLVRQPGWVTVYFDDTAVISARDTPAQRALIEEHGYRALDPQRPEPLLFLVGDPGLPAAITEADRALARGPAVAAAHVLRAAVAAAAGDEARVKREIGWLRAGGAQVSEELLEATALIARGRARDAAARLAPAARRPEAVTARLLLGRALLDSGDIAGARHLLAPHAALPEAQLLLAAAAQREGQETAARALETRFLTAAGTDPVYAARAARIGAALGTTKPDQDGTRPSGD
jgi:hypothetical protein